MRSLYVAFHLVFLSVSEYQIFGFKKLASKHKYTFIANIISFIHFSGDEASDKLCDCDHQRPGSGPGQPRPGPK